MSWKPALFNAVITDKLPIGGNPVGTGRIGVVKIKIFGKLLLRMEMVYKVDNLVVIVLEQKLSCVERVLKKGKRIKQKVNIV